MFYMFLVLLALAVLLALLLAPWLAGENPSPWKFELLAFLVTLPWSWPYLAFEALFWKALRPLKGL